MGVLAFCGRAFCCLFHSSGGPSFFGGGISLGGGSFFSVCVCLFLEVPQGVVLFYLDVRSVRKWSFATLVGFVWSWSKFQCTPVGFEEHQKDNSPKNDCPLRE